METPKSAFKSNTGEQSRRRIALEFDSAQPSEDSGLFLDSPRASSTPSSGVKKSSMVGASPKYYRRRERRSWFDWCYSLLWLAGIIAAIAMVGILTAITGKVSRDPSRCCYKAKCYLRIYWCSWIYFIRRNSESVGHT